MPIISIKKDLSHKEIAAAEATLAGKKKKIGDITDLNDVIAILAIPQRREKIPYQ